MGEFGLISISKSPYIIKDIKKVPGNCNTVHRLNTTAILNQKTLHANRNISTDWITSCLAFQFGYK